MHLEDQEETNYSYAPPKDMKEEVKEESKQLVESDEVLQMINNFNKKYSDESQEQHQQVNVSEKLCVL